MKKRTDQKIALFEGRKIRRKWDEREEKWYFSVVDIVQVLTDQPNYQTARKYWNKLAERLKKEGSEAVTKCHRLKMEAEDGNQLSTSGVEYLKIFGFLNSSIPYPT